MVGLRQSSCSSHFVNISFCFVLRQLPTNKLGNCQKQHQVFWTDRLLASLNVRLKYEIQVIKNFRVEILKKGFKPKGDQKGGPLFSPYRVTGVSVCRDHRQNLHPDYAEVMVHTHACSFHGLSLSWWFLFLLLFRDNHHISQAGL